MSDDHSRHSPPDDGARALQTHAAVAAWQSYAVAVTLVALATVLTWLLALLIGGERPRFPFALFFPTVVIITRYGGRAAGWFAIALCALISSYLFIPPLYTFRIGSEGLMQVGVFVFITLLTTYLMERSTRAETAQSRLAAIVESSDDAILSKTLDGVITSWNASSERMYGYTAAEVLGKPVSIIIPKERAGELTEILTKIRRGEVIEHLETMRVRKDGTPVEVSLTISPVKDAKGRLIGASTIARDISERRRAEKAVHESEQRLLAIANTASDAIITIDEDSRILFINAAAIKIFGYTSEEMIGCSLTMLMPDYLRRAHEQALGNYVETGERHISWESIELPGLHKTGREIALEVSFAEFKKDNKHYFTGIARDITERKRIEEAMRESEERYRYLAEAMPQIVWTARADGYIDYYNARWFEYTGLTLEQTEGWGWQPVLHPDDIEQCLKSWSKSVTTGERYDIEYRFKRASDGAYRWHLGRAEPMRDAEGQIVRWFGTATDIHDRRQAAESLRFMSEASELLTSSLNYEATLERLALLCVAALADYCLIDVVEDDGEMRRVATAHRDPAQKELVRALKSYPPDARRAEGVSKVLRTGRPEISTELSAEKLRELTSDDEHRELLKRLGLKSYMTLPLRTRGRIVGALTFAVTGEAARAYTATDLTFAQELARRAALAIDNARLYSRAQEANKAKDEFLATLSHELRTPLTPIIGWLQMIRDGRISAEDSRHGLAIIEKNSQALTRLINDLLDMSSILSGKMRIERAPVNVDAALREAVETIRTQADSRGIPVEILECDGDAQATVSGDRTRLVQVFWNLLNNSVKFSDKGQRITVGCEARDGVVRVTVADEGRGMEPEFLPHAFERFRQADSTTTRVFGGLGIGLALVKSFVEAHGGTTTVESEGAGRGSRFTVTLPRLNAPASTDVVPPTDEVERCDAEVCRVLVVEDARDTLDMLQVVFEMRGYHVTTCSTAEEALRVAQTAAFDIIVSDIGLPQIDGYELIRRLRAIPHLRDVPAVALTGYAAPRDAQTAFAAGFNAHIPKPVDPATLASEIEQLLQRRTRHEDS